MRTWALAALLVVALLAGGKPQAQAAALPEPACSKAQPCRCDQRNRWPDTGQRPLRATFLGVSTILFDDGEQQLLVDGFFTRPTVAETLIGPIGPRRPLIEKQLRRLGVTNLRAVLVAHGHHDHALDAPTVAALTGSVLLGSKSVGNIEPDQPLRSPEFCEASSGGIYHFGRFTVTAFASPHSRSGAILTSLLEGRIEQRISPPAWFWEYKDDQNYSYLIESGDTRVLVHPSTNFHRGMYGDLAPVDAVFLGIGRLGKDDLEFGRSYWCEVVEQSGARLVFPIHWDRFTTSLESPLQDAPWPLDNVDVARRRVRDLAAPGWTVRYPVPFETMTFGGLSNRGAKPATACPASPSGSQGSVSPTEDRHG